MDSFDKQTQATFESLQHWLNQDEEGREVMARFQANPEGETSTLVQWLQSHREQVPPQLATYVSGGQVEKIVNIAQAGVVFIQQAIEPPSPVALYQLPPNISDFTGREKQQEEAMSLLGRAAQGIGTVIWAVAGMAGVGKSALALHVAHAAKADFPDAQFYVNLRGAEEEPMDSSDALKDLLQALGVKDAFMPKDLAGQARFYRSLLSVKRALVLLDNAYDEAQVRPLLPASSTCAVIITSRRRLSALEGAKILDLQILSEESALSLLRRLAGVDRVSEDIESAKRVVGLCGYLPLALRIAAGKLNDKPHWSLQDYATQLADERSRLTRLQLGDLEVRSTFALSFQELSEDDAKLFRLLGVLDRPEFFLSVASGLLGKPMTTARDALERLADAQLIEPQAGRAEGWEGGRAYRIHDLIRLFATERLEQECSPEERADARRRVEEGWSLNGLANFAFLKSIEATESSWQEAVRNYNKLIKTQRKLGVSDSRSEDSIMKSVAGLHARIGLSYGEKGDWSKAIRKVKMSIKILRDSSAADAQTLALAEEGIAYATQGKAEKALNLWRTAIAAIDPAFEAHRNLKILQQFLVEFEEKEKLRRSMGEQAFAFFEQGQMDKAMELFKSQENLILELKAEGERVGIVTLGGTDDKDASLLANYSAQVFILGAQENLKEAADVFGRVQELASGLDDDGSYAVEKVAKTWLADSYRQTGASAWNEGRPDEARERLGLALLLYRELSDTETIEILESVLKELEE
jgi:tetratricopeptide (TPR) repeat protein